ncbi:unnamed protein product [Rhizoctonia solani]|uniref:Fungal-type protein kinase domain-containing protein n=1 Tax=Rhizoctonia solani TaxID=456999 RepID=A0A8H2XXG0_9AGAM|nr:unnamed protein product [Rhizoctonia solani]
MDAVLPTIRSSKLNEVYKRLVSSGSIQLSNKNGPRWRCLPQDPSASEGSQTETFQFLEIIAQDITESHSMTPALDVKLSTAGETTHPDSRGDTSYPDGFIHRKSVASGNVKWTDMIMPMEFEKGRYGQSQIDSFAKMMWSLHYIMRNDARRRYAHGLSFQDTTARLWFINRSDVLVSNVFDVNKDWKYLVRIILTMLVATPGELGYDLDTELVTSNDGSAESYDITIRNPDAGTTKVYRTIEIISDAGVDSMVGHGARVWEVQRLVDGVPVGPSYALKDAWIYEDRIGEHVILKKIRKEQPAYAQHFLTPMDHCFVPVDPALPSILDNTHRNLSHRTVRNLKLTGMVLSTRFSYSVTTIVLSPLWERVDFGLARRHYRIVFKEIGESVHDLGTFADVFIAIQGGWEGLHAMNLSGYVHRDGTYDFMATEVEFATHKRLATLRHSRQPIPTLEQSRKKHERRSLEPRPPPPPLPSFRHNPLHDMESVWWLCVWMMFDRGLAEEKNEERRRNYRAVFGSQYAKEHFSTFCEFREYTSHLPETPDFISTIKSWLGRLDYHYANCYDQQDSSTNPPTILLVDDDTLRSSYHYGRKALKMLENASGSLRTSVGLSEQHQGKSPRRVLDYVLMPTPKEHRARK